MSEAAITDQGTLVRISEHAGVQTWRMANGPVNALNPALLQELESAIAAVVVRQDIAVVVLSSELRVFSAGADAAWMAATVAEIGPEGLLGVFNETMDSLRSICIALRQLPALVIAAIDGHCLAGGLELAAACDLRICTDSPKVQIGVPEMDLFGAMPSGGGGVQYLARLMGPARALEFLLHAKPITPQRAFELGLVERLAPAGNVLTTAQEFAGQLAAKAGRVGVHAAKRAVFEGIDLPIEKAITLDREIHWDAMRNGNFLTGVKGFVEKFGGAGKS